MKNSYFLLEFYKIKQQSECFVNCFLSITVFFFVRVVLMMTFIKPFDSNPPPPYLKPPLFTTFLKNLHRGTVITAPPSIWDWRVLSQILAEFKNIVTLFHSLSFWQIKIIFVDFVVCDLKWQKIILRTSNWQLIHQNNTICGAINTNL